LVELTYIKPNMFNVISSRNCHFSNTAIPKIIWNYWRMYWSYISA